MLRPFAHLVHVVVCCCVLLVVDAQSLKTVKRYPGADGRNNSQHCWAKKIGSCCVHLHIVAPTMLLIVASLLQW